MVKLIVDAREVALIEALSKHDITVEVIQITTGDIIIEHNDVYMAVIERKTIQDLADSIKDGRMRNKEKLYQMREETKCDVIFVIEGDWAGVETSKCDRLYGIHTKSLTTTINKLQVVDKCFINVTANVAHTAIKLIYLANMYVTHIQSASATPYDITAAYHKSEAVVYMNIIMALPGMYNTNISLIYGLTLAEITSQIPANLPPSTRTALSNMTNKLFWKMMSKIPGISDRIVTLLEPHFSLTHFTTQTHFADITAKLNVKTSKLPALIYKYVACTKLNK